MKREDIELALSIIAGLTVGRYVDNQLASVDHTGPLYLVGRVVTDLSVVLVSAGATASITEKIFKDVDGIINYFSSGRHDKVSIVEADDEEEDEEYDEEDELE